MSRRRLDADLFDDHHSPWYSDGFCHLGDAHSRQSSAGTSRQSSASLVVKRLREDQGRCSAEVNQLQSRVDLLDRRVAGMAADMCWAAAGRVPLVVGEMPPRRRLRTGPGSAATLLCAAEPTDVAALVADLRQEFHSVRAQHGGELEAFREALAELRSSLDSRLERLDAALDAARSGIARLAKDSHYDRVKRDGLVTSLEKLAIDIGGEVIGPASERMRAEFKVHVASTLAEEVLRMEAALASRLPGLISVWARAHGVTSGGIICRDSGDKNCQASESAPVAHFVPHASAAGGLTAAAAAPELSASASGCRVARQQLDEDEALQVDYACKKVLQEYVAAEADGDVRSTKLMLMQFGVFERLALNVTQTPEDLVTRPTFRFVHQVVRIIDRLTGYPGRVPDVPDLKDEKVRFLEHLWLHVVGTLAVQDGGFCAEDVVRCMNRGRTRRLLQLLLLAAAKERSIVLGPSMPSRKDESQKLRVGGGMASLEDLLPSFVPMRSLLSRATSVLSP